MPDNRRRPRSTPVSNRNADGAPGGAFGILLLVLIIAGVALYVINR